jgi:hypothetical protein
MPRRTCRSHQSKTVKEKSASTVWWRLWDILHLDSVALYGMVSDGTSEASHGLGLGLTFETYGGLGLCLISETYHGFGFGFYGMRLQWIGPSGPK